MRLTCEVQLSSRLMPTLGMKKSGKPARCQIALGRKPASVDKTVYLMVSTNQNPSGNMFKVGYPPPAAQWKCLFYFHMPTATHTSIISKR